MAENTFRPHVPPHKRSMQEQTLDALLRIEELLVKLVRAKSLEELAVLDAPMIEDRGNYEDRVTPKTPDKPKGGRDGKRRL